MRTDRIARAITSAAVFAVVAACGKAGGSGGQQVATNERAPAGAPPIAVYKSPTCGCCNNWVAHMRQAGYRVETHDVDSLDAVKNRAGVPRSARSCHTGLVGGYAIEGHVPADVVAKLLREHPADVAGLAVPGMVTGSPGMEGPNPQHYDVIAFTRDGRTRVYASR